MTPVELKEIEQSVRALRKIMRTYHRDIEEARQVAMILHDYLRVLGEGGVVTGTKRSAVAEALRTMARWRAAREIETCS